MNLASGKSVLINTSDYLLWTLKRGKVREKFTEEWRNKPRRFLRPVKRAKIENFAAESTKDKTQYFHSKPSLDRLRDIFARLLVVAQRSLLDLPYFLLFPITVYIMALALPDGILIKTQKSKLLHKLEDLLKDQIDEVVGMNFALYIYMTENC